MLNVLPTSTVKAMLNEEQPRQFMDDIRNIHYTLSHKKPDTYFQLPGTGITLVSWSSIFIIFVTLQTGMKIFYILTSVLKVKLLSMNSAYLVLRRNSIKQTKPFNVCDVT